MTVTGRKHNTDDIIATVLAVEPMKFIYRGRIAVFSIKYDPYFTLITFKMILLYKIKFFLSIFFANKFKFINFRVLRDERICVVAEQRPDCSEEEVLLVLIA